MPVLTFEVTEAEAEAIRAEASEQRLNLSEYLRASAKPKATAIQRNDDLTPGRVILNSPPITTEQLHAALYDDF
jgi:hypothetical protein